MTPHRFYGGKNCHECEVRNSSFFFVPTNGCCLIDGNFAHFSHLYQDFSSSSFGLLQQVLISVCHINFKELEPVLIDVRSQTCSSRQTICESVCKQVEQAVSLVSIMKRAKRRRINRFSYKKIYLYWTYVRMHTNEAEWTLPLVFLGSELFSPNKIFIAHSFLPLLSPSSVKLETVVNIL